MWILELSKQLFSDHWKDHGAFKGTHCAPKSNLLSTINRCFRESWGRVLLEELLKQSVECSKKHSLHQTRALRYFKRIQYITQRSFLRDETRHLNLSGPTPLKWSFNFLSDPPALRWLWRRSGVAGEVHSSSAELLILSLSSFFLQGCALRAPLHRPPTPSSLLSWNAPSPPSSPGLTSGTDLGSALMVTKFLGTASAFGSWTCVWCEQHPPAPLDLTAAFDLLIFYFFFYSPSPPFSPWKKKPRKLLPDNTWCKCKIMLWNDCKHAVFQMFDETVKKRHKEGSTVSVRGSAGFHMKK